MDPRRQQRRIDAELEEYGTRPNQFWSLGRVTAAFAAGIIALVLLFVFLGMFYTVEEYERGILTRNGAFVKVLHPGFGTKAPWVDEIPVRINLRVKTYKWPHMESYSADGQQAFLDVSVTLRPKETKIEQLYKQHRSVDSAVQELLSPLMNKDAKVVFGQYSASRAISDRGQLNLDTEKVVRDALGPDTVLEILSVQNENIEFSKEYLNSIEGRMRAQVEVEKHRQELEKEKVQADIKRTQAAAEAFRIQSIGNAEAEAIRAKSKAMYENPSYIQLIQAEKWDGKLPQTMLPNQTMPIIEMTPNASTRQK